MDYERIQKRSSNTHLGNVGGALSPRRLRSVLLGVDDKTKRNKHQDQDIGCSLRTQVSQFGDSDGCFSDDCKDVDVVSVQTECTNSFTVDAISDRKSDNSLVKSSLKSQDNYCPDYDGGQEYMSVPSPMFEFPKRGALASFSKPTPSKWDDAHKWIASPTSNRTKGGGLPPGNSGSRKTSNFGFGNRKPATKVVVEVPDQRLVPFEEPDTKMIDCSETKRINGCKVVGWEADTYSVPESDGKEITVLDNCVAESRINISHDDISVPTHNETTYLTPPSTAARSVSMRDMGTEMTPVASQEPSRSGTPVRATTPDRSQTTSRSSTPQRTTPTSSLMPPAGNNTDLDKELSEKEMQMKTRREIIALGTQLGKTNIAAWASKEEDNNAFSTYTKNGRAEETAKSLIEARAAAWEEAEKAKYIARFKREEMKIHAWEDHEKAKAEAEMRKTEVKVESMRGRAHDRLMNKLSGTKRKAEEKRAYAEEKRKQQDAKTEQKIECIRTSTCLPSFRCCSWCL